MCASRLYLSLPSAVSRAPFHPQTLAPREGRTRGWISRRPVRNIPSPPASNSLSLSLSHSLSVCLSLPLATTPSSSSRARAMSQPTFTPEARELGGLPGALLPPPLPTPRLLLTPLTAHKVRTVRGRWFQGVVVGLE